MKQIYSVHLNSIRETSIWNVLDLSWSWPTTQSMNSRWHFDVVILVPFRSIYCIQITAKLLCFASYRYGKTEQVGVDRLRSKTIVEPFCNVHATSEIPRTVPWVGKAGGSWYQSGHQNHSWQSGQWNWAQQSLRISWRRLKSQWLGSSKNFSSFFLSFEHFVKAFLPLFSPCLFFFPLPFEQ